MTPMVTRGVRIAAGAALALGALAILRPWTIRPIESAPVAPFDVATWVSTAWPRVIEEAARTALDIEAARAAAVSGGAGSSPSRRPVFVRVTGIVTDVERRSRVGVVRIRAGSGSAAPIVVQVGPVLRGTAIRDALSFVRFTDFANQTEFAAVSNALNDRVLQDVVGRLDLGSLTGRTLTVIGAASFAGLGSDRAVNLVPVTLRIEGGER